MSLSGLKDIDREVLKYIDDRELLEICTIDRQTWNEVCDDAFLRRRLNKYPGIEKYKKENESWKQFFLRAIYYISKMKDEFDFIYTSGDFKEKYMLLKTYNKTLLLVVALEKGHKDLATHAFKTGAKLNAGAIRAELAQNMFKNIPRNK